MIKKVLCAVSATLLLLACPANAGGKKPLNLGVASYALAITNDNALADDDEFTGLSLTTTYAFSDMIAFRGVYYILEHDDLEQLENNGIDLLVLIGSGLATGGFKAYVGGGTYSERWELSGFEQDFRGLQLHGGVGYNWDVIALDFTLALRETGDYDDFVKSSVPTISVTDAASASLLLSLRF